MDNNVTRHLPLELKQNDWDGMVLHYLGLDHIGHKSGPQRYSLPDRCALITHADNQSPYMLPKQLEMDGIVEQIFEAMTSNDHLASTLLVLCGDHGMNDAGNHGGSTLGETSTALLFISPKMESISSGFPCPINDTKHNYQFYSGVEQSDIAPTLAGLLGFPVPLNNLGVFIADLLPFWPKGLLTLEGTFRFSDY